MTLRHRCEQHGCYKDKLPDWSILDGCFPRGIRPSDIDGIVELNEHALLLEWKPRDGVLTKGQRLLFQNLTRGSPKVQALIVYGDPSVPSEIELIQRGQRRFRQRCELEFLRWFCEQWSVFAERTKGQGQGPGRRDLHAAARWEHSAFHNSPPVNPPPREGTLPMRKVVATSLLAGLAICFPALACQFDTDCDPGNKCVKRSGQIYGVCYGGISPGQLT